MKKTILYLIMCLMLSVTAVPISAAEIIDYGEPLYWASMEGGYAYYVNFDNKGTCICSTDEANSGKMSYRLDMNAEDSINLHINGVGDLTNYPELYDNYVYFEMSIKGYETKPAGLSTYLCYRYKTDGSVDYSTIPITETVDERGWHKYSALYAPQKDIKSFTSVVFYRIDKELAKTVPYLYFDDFKAIMIPRRIEINSIKAAYGETVDLNKLIVYGFDAKGNKKQVKITDEIKWTVTRGIASVNGSLLRNTGNENTITVEADFYGVKTSFDVQFDENPISSNTVFSQDKSLKATFTNNGETAVDAAVMTVVYDGDKLYKTYYKRGTAQGGATLELSTPAVKLFDETKNVTVKKFIWNSVDGFREV